MSSASQLSGERKEDARFLRALELRVPLDRRFSVIHAGKPTLIDHILASPTLARACVDVSILHQGLQDEVFVHEPNYGSLHAPVVAFFRFATGAALKVRLRRSLPAGRACLAHVMFRPLSCAILVTSNPKPSTQVRNIDDPYRQISRVHCRQASAGQRPGGAALPGSQWDICAAVPVSSCS